MWAYLTDPSNGCQLQVSRMETQLNVVVTMVIEEVHERYHHGLREGVIAQICETVRHYKCDG